MTGRKRVLSSKSSGRSNHCNKLQIDVRIKDEGVVHSGLIRFRGLLYELGQPAQRDETLLIKVEVDTRPPAGAALETTVVRRYELLRLQHHDRPSLLSGKLHAILQRPYAKGRDLYDLLWYLAASDWPPPNLVMLNNALAQTGWTGGTLTADNWHDAIYRRLQQLDWAAVVADVQPFLIESHQAEWLTREQLVRLLGR